MSDSNQRSEQVKPSNTSSGLKHAPLVPSPPAPEHYGLESLSFISDAVATAAKRFNQGKLDPVLKRQYATDDGPILTFLNSVNELSEPMALTKLARLLRCYPTMLGHPWIWSIFENLYYKWSADKKLDKYRENWLIQLTKAWAEGITVGLEVSIAQSQSRPRGRPLALFPHLLEMDGWLPSDAARAETRDAIEFLDLFETLYYRFRSCGGWSWKELGQQFDQKPDLTVRMVASDIGKEFEKFKEERKLRGQPLDEARLREIVRSGLLQKYKGQPMRREIVYELVATFEWTMSDGTKKPLTASLIHKTIATLRKHFREDWVKSMRRWQPYAAEWVKKRLSVPADENPPSRLVLYKDDGPSATRTNRPK